MSGGVKCVPIAGVSKPGCRDWLCMQLVSVINDCLPPKYCGSVVVAVLGGMGLLGISSFRAPGCRVGTDALRSVCMVLHLASCCCSHA
jgi:hypothetical protein